MPVQADVPFIDVVYTDAPDPHTPLGAHGIGEIGITGVAAAIANAVYHATGRRITDLPITPRQAPVKVAASPRCAAKLKQGMVVRTCSVRFRSRGVGAVRKPNVMLVSSFIAQGRPVAR